MTVYMLDSVGTRCMCNKLGMWGIPATVHTEYKEHTERTGHTEHKRHHNAYTGMKGARSQIDKCSCCPDHK
jgi:hypothetical protein